MTNISSTSRCSPTSSTTLVLGASGKTGRRVADRLTASGRPERAASRSGETRFDWHDEATWAPALAGVDAVQAALDRPARDFADYARDTAATGVWNLEAQAS